MDIHSVVYSWLIIYIVISLDTQETHSTGFVELEFVSYLNEDNGKADGQCCERDTSVCRYACNNVFSICLSNTTTMQSCQYGSYTSDIISSDDFDFGGNEYDSTLGSPYKFLFDKWQGNVTIKINVNLKDNGGLISQFPQTTLPMKPSLFNTSTSQPLTFSWGKSRKSKAKEKRLMLKYKIECDEDYLIPDCHKKHCIAQNNVTTTTATTTAKTATRTTLTTTTAPTTKNETSTKETKRSKPELLMTSPCLTTPAKSLISSEFIIYTIAGSMVFLAVVITGISLVYYKVKRKRRMIHPDRIEIAPINNNSKCAKTDGFFKGPHTTNVEVYNY